MALRDLLTTANPLHQYISGRNEGSILRQRQAQEAAQRERIALSRAAGQRQNQLLEMELAKYKNAQAQQARARVQQEQMDKWINSLPPDQRGLALGNTKAFVEAQIKSGQPIKIDGRLVDPRSFETLYEPPKEPLKASYGDRFLHPETYKPLYTAPDRPFKPPAPHRPGLLEKLMGRLPPEERAAAEAAYVKAQTSGRGADRSANQMYRMLSRDTAVMSVDGKDQIVQKDNLGNVFDMQGNRIAGPGYSQDMLPYVNRMFGPQAPDAVAQQIPEEAVDDLSYSEEPAPGVQGSVPTFGPPTRQGTAPRPRMFVGTDKDGKQVVTTVDPIKGKVRETQLRTSSPSIITAPIQDIRKVDAAFETNIRPHLQIMDVVEKFNAARNSGDNSQVNLLLAQIVQRIARSDNRTLKGDVDAILGTTFRGGSIDDRIANFLTQLTRGTVTDSILNRFDRIVSGMAQASLRRIDDEMRSSSAKLVARGRDPTLWLSPRKIGRIVIWPGVGPREYQSVEEANADMREWERAHRGKR